MPRRRGDHAACAICMESLFNKLDDLDQLVPATAPDCGHVFHEPCLQEWFRTQSIQYLAQAREHRLDRDPSPSLSDAPALCPSCRTECYADPETGEPALHRLYINFADDGGGSSQVGSSPVRQSTSSRRKEEEVMGIARRAKGLREEARGLGDDSTEQDVDGFLTRAEGLRDDAVSVKAIQGIKTYVGGLTTAINSFRSTLANSPLPMALQNQVNELENSLKTMERNAKETKEKTIPAIVRAVKKEERAAAEKKAEKAKADMDLLRRGLEHERVQKRELRKAAEERDQESQREIETLKKQLKKEEEDREAAEDTLRERTKQLRKYQAKLESKKELKELFDKLEQENRVLKSRLESTTPAGGNGRSDGLDEPATPGKHDEAGSSSGQGLFLPGSHRSRSPLDVDESLEVELPSFADERHPREPPSGKAVQPTASSSRLHPTARTFSFNADDSVSRVAKKRRPQRSKYFQADDTEDDIDEVESDRDDADDSGIIIQASSPQRPSPTKRSRTNPFSTTRDAQAARTKLVPRKKEVEVIDLASSSPRSPFKQNSTNIPVRSGDSSKQAGNQRNTLTDYITGMTDKNGRPKKGLASGARVRHRA